MVVWYCTCGAMIEDFKEPGLLPKSPQCPDKKWYDDIFKNEFHTKFQDVGTALAWSNLGKKPEKTGVWVKQISQETYLNLDSFLFICPQEK